MKSIYKVSVLIIASQMIHNAHAQQSACSSENAALQAISDKYKPQYSSVEDRGNALGNEAPEGGDYVKFDVKVDMKEQKWILNLPSVTMKTNKAVLGLPQTTMKLQTWSFDSPETRMVLKKIGQKPEFTCKKDNWGIPYGCTVKWSDIFAHVPETSMVRKEIKLDIPEFTWKNVDLSWDIPHLTWVENTWIVKVPEFTLQNVAAQKGEDLKGKAEDLEKEIHTINANRTQDSLLATTGLYSCFKKEIVIQQASIEKDLDVGINSLTASIDSIRAQGADPTKIPSDSGKAVDLVATLSELIAKKRETSETFEKAKRDLDKSEIIAMNKFKQ